MQLKVELRSKGGWEKERDTLSRELYDFPRSFQGEVKLRRKK